MAGPGDQVAKQLAAGPDGQELVGALGPPGEPAAPADLASFLRHATQALSVLIASEPGLPIPLGHNSARGECRPTLREEMPPLMRRLTAREREVLCWLAAGKTNAQIALILGMSTRTVQKHLEHIFVKLGVETRTAAIARVLGLGAALQAHM
jgi:DNA-binding CsgD family transcriptional regulator